MTNPFALPIQNLEDQHIITESERRLLLQLVRVMVGQNMDLVKLMQAQADEIAEQPTHEPIADILRRIDVRNAVMDSTLVPCLEILGAVLPEGGNAAD